jgi:hypothetical protein
MDVRRLKPSGTMLVAVVALVIGLEAPAMAHQVNVVAHKISGSQLKPNSVTGKQIKESSLGVVPKAAALTPLVWHKVKLINHWTNVNSERRAAYAIDAQGVVHLQGDIEGGDQFTAAFKLPAAARPDQSVNIPVELSALRVGDLDVESTGPVTPEDGTNPSGTASTGTMFDGVVYSPK